LTEIPENQTKLQPENPFKKPEPINGKTEKLRRKNNSSFITIKMGGKSERLSSKPNVFQFNEPIN
jgi:hypothetical protein